MPYVGLLQEGIKSMPGYLEKAQANGYDVITASLHPREILRSTAESHEDNFALQMYSDLILSAEEWNNKVISIYSDEIDCDSTNPEVQRRSEEKMISDISFADHLKYSGCSMVRLKKPNNTNLARVLSSNIKGMLFVHVPLFNKVVAHSVWRSDIELDTVEEVEEKEHSWNWWNDFRTTARFHPKIKVVLELSPDDQPTNEVLCRWLGEPVEAVVIPSNIFIMNRKNYPVLPKSWQIILSHFVHNHINFIVSAAVDDNGIKSYSDYLRNFYECHKDNHMLTSYEDILEIPLQPLYDNLDCYTYEVFEKDPIKYRYYQDAIAAALVDRVPKNKIEEQLTVVMVLGAGRGPLARAALNAAKKTGRKIRVYIIEKNPNAIRTIVAIVKKLWSENDVHVFSQDMRYFDPPERADILVSELLGSFGDNELSPECLDCAQRLLKPDGISIPCKSTSYINPLMSSKLYNGIRHLCNTEQSYGPEKRATYETNSETSYVVLLKNVYNIDKPKPLFEFVHPNYESPINNRRYKKVTFEAELDCVLNGFGGYFDTELYKDIKLSINPLTHTKGMPSWFPIYFPIAQPINVKKGQTIELHFWRCTSKQKIWYEWCVCKPVVTHIHNPGGNASCIYCA